MNWRRLIEKKWWVMPGVAGFLATLITRIPSDLSHEIEMVGSRWVYGHEILYVQVWSRFSPQTLVWGALYRRYIGDNVILAWLFEAVLVAMLFGGILLAIHTLRVKSDTYKTLLVPFSLLLLVPSVWERGVTASKISAVLLSLSVGLYMQWRVSGSSVWLFGETSKNFRYLALAGVALSFCVTTSPWLSIIALVFFVDAWFTLKRNWREWLRWTSFLVLPLSVHGWVWYSVLQPRNLFTQLIHSTLLSRYSSMHATSYVPVAILAVMAILTVGVWVLATFQSTRPPKRDPLLGLLAVAGFVVICLLGTGIAEYALIIGVIIVLTSLNHKLSSGAIKNIMVLCAIAVVPILVQNMSARTTSQLETTRLQLARAYVVQRNSTDTSVLYIGRSTGFYDENLVNSTAFYDTDVFKIDEQHTHYGLEGMLRGQAEAEAIRFIVLATDSSNGTPLPARLTQYIDKHFDQSVELDGYTIYKRK